MIFINLATQVVGWSLFAVVDIKLLDYDSLSTAMNISIYALTLYAPTILLALDGFVLLGSLVRVKWLMRRYPELETNAKYMSLHLVVFIMFTASNTLYSMSFFVKAHTL